ncbi:MAG: ATP-binding protein [Candidatus Limnocylindria bacterium]
MNAILRLFGVRLFLSYLLVIGVGALTLLVTGSLLASSFFEDHLHQMGGAGMGGMGGAMGAELQRAVADSVQAALLLAVVASVLAAGVVAALVGRRLVRPIEAVRAATHRLAAGDYRQRVPVPPEFELAALAEDVNALAQALATTESKRIQLIDEVAHELRTPLTTIEGYMEGLIDGVLPPSEETFAAVADEAARLKRLAEDLSQLSRAEEGTFSLTLRDVDLAEVAARAAERLRPQFEDRGVNLELAAAPPLPVRVDPDRLAQVLTNLLGNALVQTPAGGMVSIRGGLDGAWAWVDVADTGQGIPPEELERIFERFYRVGGGADTRPGRGIGLTIARGIARAHEGDLRASSVGLGQGATFRVTLPLARRV